MPELRAFSVMLGSGLLAALTSALLDQGLVVYLSIYVGLILVLLPLIPRAPEQD